MSTPTNAVNDVADSGQKVLTSALSAWTDTMQSFAGTLTPGDGRLTDLRGFVEQYFDLAEKTLAGQRTFALQWLSGAAEATSAVSEQARSATLSATDDAANAVETAAGQATETVHAVADQAPAPVTDAPSEH